MINLQFGVFEQLSQYGVLGLVTLSLGFVVWYLLKRQIDSEDRLKNKVDDLQREINGYIREDQNKFATTIDNNTQALRDLRDMIIKNVK
jgi:uncharacterized membrane-anchored protein YhcB (DUF1043 family)